MVKNTIQTNPDLLEENLITIQQAGKNFAFPVGRKAVERYIRHGIRGIRLETVLIGNRRLTSQEAIRRFLHATNKGPENNETVPTMSEAELQSAKQKLGLR